MIDSKAEYRISPNETNVIKGIAICAMLWHHLFLGYREYGEMTFKLALTCKACVALFVFLSGYGMAMQYKKQFDEEINQKNKRHVFDRILFLLRRYAKFYMNYWVVFVITVPFGVLIFGRSLADAYGSESLIWHHLISDFFGIAGLESYNVTWWFNRLIIILWLLFPLLYWTMYSKLVSVWMLVFLYCDPGSLLHRFTDLSPGFTTYLFIFAFGIFLAENTETLDKALNKINQHVILAAAIVVTISLLYMRNHYVLSFFLGIKGDPFIAVFLSLAVVSICRLTHRKMSALAFAGKHSMNMYLVHTFVCSYFFHDFIYGFKYPILIFAVLLMISLQLSIVVELFKKNVGFYRLQNFAIHALKIQKKPLD